MNSLEDKTYKEILDNMLDLSSELSERSQTDCRERFLNSKVEKIHIQEIEAVRNIELAVGEARTLFEETGKIGV